MSEGPGTDGNENAAAISDTASRPDLRPLSGSAYDAFATDGNIYFGWAKGRFRIRRGTLARTRSLHEFPLTEEGWASAWKTMVSEYPTLAAQVAAHVHRTREAKEGPRRRAQADVEGKRELDALTTYVAIPDCTLLGGYGWDEPELRPGTSCTLRFTEQGLWVHPSSGHRALIRSPYRDAMALEFTGPGRVTQGGGFFGGGFGLTTAAEGMIVASVLNALTTRTTIHTVIRYQATQLEAFFFYSKATPGDLRVQLSRVLSMIRPEARPKERDTVSEFERLAELHRAGALNDDEFASLKSKIIADL